MKLDKCISITSPLGLWEYRNLIGAKVKISSLPVGYGLFGYDSEAIYVIEDIFVRMSKFGKSYAVVKLEGENREFALKDLEILSLPFNLWHEATCNKFLCGNALCGYDVDGGSGDVSINDESGRTSSGEVIITIDGDVLT